MYSSNIQNNVRYKYSYINVYKGIQTFQCNYNYPNTATIGKLNKLGASSDIQSHRPLTWTISSGL